MSDTAGKGMLSGSGSRPPFFRYLMQLYGGDQVFAGLVDFALIGGVVMLFMHPPSMDWFCGWLARSPAPAAKTEAPAAGTPQANQAAAKPSTPSSTSKPTPTPTPSGRPAPQTLPPAQSGSAVSAGIAMPLLEEVKRPRLFVRFLFEIDESVFRSSEPEDRPKLQKAVQDYRAYHYTEMLDRLAGARSSDPNVAFMRGVASLYNSRGALATDQLRAAIAGGQVQAGTILGVVQVAGNASGVDKDVEGGKRLIEQAAAKGDRAAMRAAGIGYVTGQTGVLDPFKAADYFKRAVAAGDIASMPLYAHMMFAGTGVQKDEAGAEELIEKAAAGGLTLAQETLGDWVLERYKAGVISDPSDGVHWLERAYQKGLSISALDRLAVFYADEGRGSQWRDRVKALEMFGMAAAFLDGRAQFGYATGLQFAYGGERDLTKAYARYELARQISGLTLAQTRMKTLDDLLSPAEKTAALDSARLIHQQLKTIPRVIVLQYPDLPEPPSPWAVPPPVAGNSATAATKP